MKRLFDLVLVVILLILLATPMLLIAFAIRLTSKGNVLYFSDRIGRGNVLFEMPKFRSMSTDTPEIATHLMTKPDVYLSLNGVF